MSVYIVTKDSRPVHATFDQAEACEMYQDTVQSGRYREAAVLAIPATTEDHQVLLSAFQAG